MKKNKAEVFVFSIWSGFMGCFIARSPFLQVSGFFFASRAQVSTVNDGPLMNAEVLKIASKENLLRFRRSLPECTAVFNPSVGNRVE